MTADRARLLAAVKATEIGAAFRASLAALLAHESGVPGVALGPDGSRLSVRRARRGEGKRGSLVAELLRPDGTSVGIVATEAGPIARRGARAGEDLLVRESVRIPSTVRDRLRRHGRWSTLARQAIEALADRLDAEASSKASGPKRRKRRASDSE